MNAPERAASLSDTGWLALVVCVGAVAVLRLPRDRLKARENTLDITPAAALAYKLWRLTPQELIRIRRLRRIVNGARTAFIGGCLGGGTLCASARVLGPSRALVASALVSLSTWVAMGLAIRRRWQREALDEGIAPRPKPRARTSAPAANDAGAKAPPTAAAAPLPVTVLTGFLGAGKTTLLRRILSEEHGRRVLVIENELGEEGIDHELIVRGGDDDNILLLRNGCVCCAIRDDLRSTLLAAVERRHVLDAVIIETTGIARPAPVLQTLLCEPKLRGVLRLDAVLTVVDCKHAWRHLGGEHAPNAHHGAHAGTQTASRAAAGSKKDGGDTTRGVGSSHERAWAEQVAYADRILLNKTDLVDHESVRRLAAAVAEINPGAPRIECERADVPMHEVLGLHSFDTSEALERHPMLCRRLEEDEAGPAEGGVAFGGATFAARIRGAVPIGGGGELLRTSCLRLSAPLDEVKFNRWVGELLQEKGEDLLRMKGVLAVEGR